MAQYPSFDKESLMVLEDDLMKQEIALFSIKGASVIKSDSLPKRKLQEIPIRRCTDQHVSFTKSSVSILIRAKDEDSEKKIKEIRVIYGGHLAVIYLPDSAFANIQEPIFCDKYTKRGKPIASNCKAFITKGRNTIYIYMLNGEGEYRYEVTWVIKNLRYFTRVIDYVP